MKEDLVLIYSLEHGQYWKPKSWGYTSDRKLAGKYPKAQAKAICEDANKHIPAGERVNEVIEEIDLNKKVTHSISKVELREWCNEIIQKEVFRKTIRFPEDKVIADTKEKMVHRILEKFCGGN